MKLSLPAPAKLNLFLHITGKKENGYHELQTLFQMLDYGDYLEIESNDSGKIDLLTTKKNIPNQENAVLHAARALQSHTACGHGAKILLKKNLPIGAGLGGGSSNAASAILGLNIVWNLKLTNTELQNIGSKIGADVPVFILGKTAWGEGIGEKLTPVDIPNNWFLVLTPNIFISTTEIFSHPGLTRNTHPIKIRAFEEKGWKNDCQLVVEDLYPEVKKARQWLANFAPARMTGTGGSIFSSFSTEDEAKALLKKIPKPWHGFVAKGVNRSPVFKILSPE
ncbi:MAG: 4-(cytidine 5'-diphospho)-2-C-methyl-D-erythritol kinase [Porticoccus sp.]|jgi:4-diphosphocytidyl-2-C-methyl-D-erythritol kinase|nr:4-(cytidine 5'-diphospho)-2-C-methyl-D-erythritol kinase [Porticoccus sp.]